MLTREHIERILIIRLAPLGETVLTTPVIRALREHYKNAYIAYMVAPSREDLVSANPHLNDVLTYNKSLHLQIHKLIKLKFDLAIILQPTFRLVLHTFLARIPFRVGFETNSGGKRLLDIAVVNNTDQHETQRYLDVVRSLNVEASDDEPEVYINEIVEQWVTEYLKTNNLNDDSKIIGLNPGAATSYRRWSSDYFAQLGDMLHNTYDANIIMTVGPNEGDLANQISHKMSHSPIIVENVTTMQLAAILQKCDLYISNDTGPMHLSTAVKTPTIALFGGSNPSQWGPVWDKHIIIAKQECQYMKKLTPKEWDEYADIAIQNLNAIKPEMVMSATEKMIW